MAKIVLADDDEDIRAVYSACFRAAGHEVAEAADGASAVDLVRSGRPDILILDLWMPGLNGFEVLDALRYDPAATRLKVAVLSSQGDADARFEAFGGGAVAYLVKGLGLAELRAQVESLVPEQ